MLIEMITPLILATSPASITVPEAQYSHATQSSPIETSLNATYSGTQTFDAWGKPRDNDND